MSFNTIYCDLKCPFCKEPVTSGIGFRLGDLKNEKYRVGDRLSWDGPQCRPRERPPGGNIKSVGYFNCDNVRCASWQDCYPQVQQALIVVENDVLQDVQVYPGDVLGPQDFPILEPADTPS